MRSMIIAAVCAAAGLLAAFTLTAKATGPVTLQDLPSLGYSLSLQFDAQTQCGIYTVVGGNGVDRDVPIGDIPPVCVLADVQAARIVSLLGEFPPAPVTTSVAVSTATVTTVVTVTEPAVTVATPAVTVAAPPETVTIAAPVPDPGWLVALAVRSVALNDVYGLA